MQHLAPQPLHHAILDLHFRPDRWWRDFNEAHHALNLDLIGIARRSVPTGPIASSASAALHLDYFRRLGFLKQQQRINLALRHFHEFTTNTDAAYDSRIFEHIQTAALTHIRKKIAGKQRLNHLLLPV